MTRRLGLLAAARLQPAAVVDLSGESEADLLSDRHGPRVRGAILALRRSL
jgi:hypothetical protein